MALSSKKILRNSARPENGMALGRGSLGYICDTFPRRNNTGFRKCSMPGRYISAIYSRISGLIFICAFRIVARMRTHSEEAVWDSTRVSEDRFDHLWWLQCSPWWSGIRFQRRVIFILRGRSRRIRESSGQPMGTTGVFQKLVVSRWSLSRFKRRIILF